MTARQRTPAELRRAIARLPEDERIVDSKVWYKSQKEHWLGWLEHYDSPGAYGRKVTSGRDARFVYNRIVCYPMLLYLIEATGLRGTNVEAAQRYTEAGPSLMARSGWIRRHVPWEVVEAALWPEPSIKGRLGILFTRRRT